MSLTIILGVLGTLISSIGAIGAIVWASYKLGRSRQQAEHLAELAARQQRMKEAYEKIAKNRPVNANDAISRMPDPDS